MSAEVLVEMQLPAKTCNSNKKNKQTALGWRGPIGAVLARGAGRRTLTWQTAVLAHGVNPPAALSGSCRWQSARYLYPGVSPLQMCLRAAGTEMIRDQYGLKRQPGGLLSVSLPGSL